jgi:beta-glucanase (GH16 family)
LFWAKYGLFQVTARMPAGMGLWPAIWLLTADISWPPEIDIMEGLQHRTREIHVGVIDGAGAGKGGWHYVGDTVRAFHTYALDWEPDHITWYFDGNTVFTEPTPKGVDKPMYLLINLAVGGVGSWPGPPLSAAPFPARMMIKDVKFFASENTVDIGGTYQPPRTPPGTHAARETKP